VSAVDLFGRIIAGLACVVVLLMCFGAIEDAGKENNPWKGLVCAGCAFVVIFAIGALALAR
jgi:hypothetical protein